MSMVFDNFPTMADANAFVTATKERFGLDGQTFATDQESYNDDPGPFSRRPYIAHIDRVELDDDPNRDAAIDRGVAAEERIHTIAPEFGGEFIGT